MLHTVIKLIPNEGSPILISPHMDSVADYIQIDNGSTCLVLTKHDASELIKGIHICLENMG